MCLINPIYLVFQASLKTMKNYLKIQLDPSLERTQFDILGGFIWIGIMQSTCQPQNALWFTYITFDTICASLCDASLLYII